MSAPDARMPKNGRMTQRYAHLAPENLREAVQVFKDDYHKIRQAPILKPIWSR